MTTATPSKPLVISLRICRILLALFMLMGAILKFMPIDKLSAMMPWTGQVPAYTVRLLALVDLAGALGLLLPSLFRMKPALVIYAAVGTALLMLCAIAFHVSRGEISVIGGNIVALIMALFIAWSQKRAQPIA